MIQIKELSFSYGKQEVLEKINTDFASNKFSVILGRNGSGKSTLFSILSGLEGKYKGEIWIGNALRKPNQIKLDNELRVGFLPQFHQATFPFSVQDLVLTGRSAFYDFKPSEKDLEAVDQILERFNLTKYKEKPYTSLSGGERQLVLLCRVLVQEPDILILDEPTNHLDLYHQVQVLNNIKRLVEEGTTILCVMHDPNMAMRYGDEIFVMHDKKLTSVQGMTDDDIHSLLEKTYNLSFERTLVHDKMMFTPII